MYDDRNETTQQNKKIKKWAEQQRHVFVNYKESAVVKTAVTHNANKPSSSKRNRRQRDAIRETTAKLIFALLELESHKWSLLRKQMPAEKTNTAAQTASFMHIFLSISMVFIRSLNGDMNGRRDG